MIYVCYLYKPMDSWFMINFESWQKFIVWLEAYEEEIVNITISSDANEIQNIFDREVHP